MLLHQEFIKNRQTISGQTGHHRPLHRQEGDLLQGPDRLADPGQEIQQISRRLHRHHDPHLGRLHAFGPRRAHGRKGAGDDQLFHRRRQQRRVRPEEMRLQDHHRLQGRCWKRSAAAWSRAWSSSRTSWQELGAADKMKALLKSKLPLSYPAEVDPPGRARTTTW